MIAKVRDEVHRDADAEGVERERECEPLERGMAERLAERRAELRRRDVHVGRRIEGIAVDAESEIRRAPAEE